MYIRKSMCFFSFFMLGVASVFSTNYYVDQNGNDTNNGLTTTTPWKTMDKVSSYSLTPGFHGGDKILFNRGQTFSNYIYFRSSGSDGNPITIDAYGNGNNPCLSSIQSLPGFNTYDNWTNMGNNIWRMTMQSDPWRVWLNGTEYVEANANASDPVSLLDSSYRWYYDGVNHYLYLWSETNPYTLSFSGLQASQYEIIFSGASYVSVQNLDLTGGSSGTIVIMNGSHNITIENCNINKSHNGILVQGIDSSWNSKPCYKICVKNNVIDSLANYSYNYEYYNLGEGVCFRSGVTDSEISGNTFRDWGHSCIDLFADFGDGIKSCKIFNNQCYGEHISYCRGFSFNGKDGLTENNEIYGNTIRNTTAPNQINCSKLYVHDNIIDTVLRSPAHPTNTIGQGLVMYAADTWPSANNNTISNNTITNCDDVGIALWNTITGSTTMSGNVIQNNIVTNCGKNVQAWRTSLAGVPIEITAHVSGTITGNHFLNNEFSGSSTCDVYYIDSSLSVYDFNQMTGDNEISGNFSNVARGKTYAMSPLPNYTLCTDSGDTTQLTDGSYYTGAGSLWVQSSTVGWSWASPVITISLGGQYDRHIEGVSFNTAAGIADVYWPAAISIEVSSDGLTYTPVGDLISRSNAENGPPPAYGTYNVHRYKTQGLGATGRYVRLTVTRVGQYVFADEIEVIEN